MKRLIVALTLSLISACNSTNNAFVPVKTDKEMCWKYGLSQEQKDQIPLEIKKHMVKNITYCKTEQSKITKHNEAHSN